MKITFIHHSCFAVELERTVLVFDYFQGNRVEGYSFAGVLPQFDPEADIYFFASHKHRDHFDMDILKLAEFYPRIHYVISKDAKMSPHFLEKHGLTQGARYITYVVPDKHYVLEGSGEMSAAKAEGSKADASGGVQIYTLRSNDAGVAFVVTAEGHTFYHAGDLHDWKFEGAGDLINGKMERDYKRQLRRLEKFHIDVAFVVLDPRLGIHTNRGLSLFMQSVGADVIFPMHMWQDYSVIREYKKLCDNQAYADRVRDIEGENQTFII